jgi:hypothetical protein
MFRSEDNQGNVLTDWTATNITGIDQPFVACRNSYLMGRHRIGVQYQNGGVDYVKFAPDGVTFA